MQYYGLVDTENLSYGFVEEGDYRINDNFIEITDKYHQELLEKQAEGFEIVSDDKTVFCATPNLYFVNAQGLWERKTEEEYEKEQTTAKKEAVAKLKLTKREVFLGLFQAKGITPDMIKAQITDPQALIEFEYANDYFRGNPLIDVIGAQLGITPEQLDKFFETNDYRVLSNEV